MFTDDLEARWVLAKFVARLLTDEQKENYLESVHDSESIRYLLDQKNPVRSVAT